MSKSLTDILRDSQPPDENEMNGSSPSPSIGSETNVSEETLAAHSTNPASPRTNGHANDLMHHLRSRLRPHRCEANALQENAQEKNHGFLLVNSDTSPLVFISTDHLDQQMTRHGVDCVHGQIEDETPDDASGTPVTPNLMPPSNSSTLTAAAVSTPVDTTDVHPQLDMQATRAGVQCVALTSELETINEAEVSASESSSASATNSSNIVEYLSNADLATLTDDAYIQVQKSVLEQVTLFEISQNETLRSFKEELFDNDPEYDVDHLYNDALARHTELTNELKRLTERRDLASKGWTCNVCTIENEPYIVTLRDVCCVCEAPSPLKRHILTS